MKARECEHGTWNGFKYTQAQPRRCMHHGFLIELTFCKLCETELSRKLICEPGVYTNHLTRVNRKEKKLNAALL
jgi:hypothetical protein